LISSLKQAGSEQYRSITRAYYRSAAAALVVFDLTDRESFSNYGYWIDSLKEYADENITTILVGNKCDVTEKYFFNMHKI